uniref:Protein kinase domain-containing protein n=1 Tax=Pan paniscus TaxID=9597 RepID=A0A2R9AJ13_PANPA
MASSSGSKAEFIIRSGSFWDLYLAIDITNGEQVAVKLESQKARHPQFKLCEILQGRLGIPHIPKSRMRCISDSYSAFFRGP